MDTTKQEMRLQCPVLSERGKQRSLRRGEKGDRAREGENTVVWGIKEDSKEHGGILCYGINVCVPIPSKFIS